MPDTEYSELIADLREQILFMQELGVDALSAELSDTQPVGASVDAGRSRAKVDRRSENLSQQRAEEKAPPPSSINFPRRSADASKQAGSRLAVLPSLRSRTSSPIRRGSSENEQVMQKRKAADAAPALIDISSTLEHSADTIESIRAEIGDCTRCKLHTLGRKQIVHTTGNFRADLMFVGEAPGADEDEQGFPFVGRAGKLLTDIIAAMGFDREQVCIGNINRCRPPENRKPEPDETAQCRPFILREIAVIKPKVIVVLGATAAHNLLQVNTPISKLRGNFQDYFGVKVMPTFHPAYLLRDPHKKREVWEDMKKVRDFLND